MNFDNLNFFIGSYKEFNPVVTNNCYKIIVGNHTYENKSNLELIKCGDENDILDDRFYSEMYMLFWLADNYKLKEYVGYCHHRKYFKFRDNIPDLDKVLSNTKVILPKPLLLKRSIREAYGMCHNIDDYDLIGKIIEENYPEYKQSFDTLSNAHSMFPCNMFIMKREDFLDYIKFIKGVLDEFVNRIGTNIEQRIIDNKDKYLKTFAPNNTIEYQYRIGGYLAERLSNVYYLKHFQTATIYDMIITEQKYDSEKGKITKIEMTK